MAGGRCWDGRRLGIGVALALAVLGGAMPARAQSPCDRLDPLEPEVAVAIELPDEPRIGQVAQAELRRRAKSADSVHHDPDTIARGLTTSRLEGEARFAMRRVKLRSGAECVALEGIEARLALEELAVLIDRRYPEDSCEYRAVLEHELEHVRISKDTLRAWEDQAEDALRKIADGWGGRWLEPAQADRFGQKVDETLSRLLRRINDDAAKQHARLDTRESYAATQRQCRNW